MCCRSEINALRPNNNKKIQNIINMLNTQKKHWIKPQHQHILAQASLLSTHPAVPCPHFRAPLLFMYAYKTRHTQSNYTHTTNDRGKPLQKRNPVWQDNACFELEHLNWAGWTNEARTWRWLDRFHWNLGFKLEEHRVSIWTKTSTKTDD